MNGLDRGARDDGGGLIGDLAGKRSAIGLCVHSAGDGEDDNHKEARLGNSTKHNHSFQFRRGRTAGGQSAEAQTLPPERMHVNDERPHFLAKLRQIR